MVRSKGLVRAACLPSALLAHNPPVTQERSTGAETSEFRISAGEEAVDLVDLLELIWMRNCCALFAEEMCLCASPIRSAGRTCLRQRNRGRFREWCSQNPGLAVGVLLPRSLGGNPNATHAPAR